jgi:hypothetical protein
MVCCSLQGAYCETRNCSRNAPRLMASLISEFAPKDSMTGKNDVGAFTQVREMLVSRLNRSYR